MKASIVELRYKMKEVLQSLARNESVKIFYCNRWIGTIIPRGKSQNKRKIKDHPFFGMHAQDKETVMDQMKRLRGGEY